MKKFDYYQPQGLKEAFNLMERFAGRARYIAGGTDLIVRIKQRAVQIDALISLRGIESLRGLHVNGGLSLGSMTLLRDLERSGSLAKPYPALVQAASVLANPQIRNVATIGGNLCNAAPSADCAPPLLVLDAAVVLEGPGGERRVRVEDFFVGPGATCMSPSEILTRVEVPVPRRGTGMSFLKTGRVSQDIAVANVAALVVMEGKKCRTCRLSAGAVAPVPLRLKEVEGLVEGKEITPELLDEAARAASQAVRPITDVRSTDAYRRHISGVLVKRAIGQALLKVTQEGGG